MSTSKLLMDMFAAMSRALGPQFWWPANSAWEVIVGAILTQNTSWHNVEKAIARLQEAGALEPRNLRALSRDRLEELIRPAGTYRVKASRLRHFVEYLFERHSGDLEHMFHQPLEQLRPELLQVRGIGRETADAILLYAGRMPTFVVDAYTARILRRHHLIDDYADYNEIKDLFESQLPRDPDLFNEYHALLVQVGKNHCKPQARCPGCPLEAFEHEPLA
jgi:endonuclease-3 related protein